MISSKETTLSDVSLITMFYVKSKGTKEVVFIALYRNDLLIFNKDPQALNVVKEQLFAKFMKDLGEVSYCLGIHTLRNMRLKTISLSQTTYIENILKCFSMETCNL
jgi:hypothetical protein